MASQILLPTSYFPPVLYFAHLAQASNARIELHEHYPKQTYRNRCRILSARGPMDLSVPVIKTEGNHTPIHQMGISYVEAWQRNHQRAILAAYNKSPYFLYYQDELEYIFTHRYETLAELNRELLETICGLIGIDCTITYTEEYQAIPEGFLDLRPVFTPKKQPQISFPAYTQVFSERLSFAPNLSILDLLFCLGPESLVYIENLKLHH